MFKDEAIDYMEELFSLPLFKRWFLEFFSTMQREGIQAAKTFWNSYHGRDDLIPKAPEIFEKLIDFYLILGFVPRQRYEVALRENENLQKENTIIMDTLRELRCSIYDGRKDMKEVLNEIMDRQTAMNKDTREGIRDFFREMKGCEREEQGIDADHDTAVAIGKRERIYLTNR